MPKENVPILVSLKRTDDTVTLRLDPDSHARRDLDSGIILLTLLGCQRIDEVTRELTEAVGKAIEYDNNDQAFWFYLDYGWNELEVHCLSWNTKETKLQASDLLARSQFLAASLDKAEENYEQTHQNLVRGETLIQTLKDDVMRSIYRAERKLEFFLTKNSSRAENTKVVIKEHKRLLRIIEEGR